MPSRYSEVYFTLVAHIPAAPEQVYDTWVSAEGHTAMTGANATLDESGRFTAWDGYIKGRYLEREPGERIEMRWRTMDFRPDEADAIVVVEFTPDKSGTRVILRQYDTPASQGDRYLAGWKDYYFTPMTAYFERG